MLGSVHDADDALAGGARAGVARPGRLRGPQRAPHVAVPDRHQHLPGRDQEAPQAGAAGRLKPLLQRPARRRGRAARRVGLARALPGRAAGARRRARLSGHQLRAAREPGAGLRRRPPAPAAQPARRADRDRGARVLRERGRRHARDHHGLGEQRTAARPQAGRRAPPRAEPAGHPALARRRAAQGHRRALHAGDGRGRRRRAADAAQRGRQLVDAPTARVVPRPRRDRRLPHREPLQVLPLAAPAHASQRTGGGGLLLVERGARDLRRPFARRARPARVADLPRSLRSSTSRGAASTAPASRASAKPGCSSASGCRTRSPRKVASAASRHGRTPPARRRPRPRRTRRRRPAGRTSC